MFADYIALLDGLIAAGYGAEQMILGYIDDGTLVKFIDFLQEKSEQEQKVLQVIRRYESAAFSLADENKKLKAEIAALRGIATTD